MIGQVRRIFIEKKKGLDVEAQKLYKELKDYIGIKGVDSLRILNKYDVMGLSHQEYRKACKNILLDPAIEVLHEEEISISSNERVIAIEYLPGQYDQRADSISQCLQLITKGQRPIVHTAKLIILKGEINYQDYENIKEYCINPMESREACLDKPETLEMKIHRPDDVESMVGFIEKSSEELSVFIHEMGFAMDMDDLIFCQKYFRDQEKREPTLTEMRMIDTYWSDHCRHTTFLTELAEINFEEGFAEEVVSSVFNDYKNSRDYVYIDNKKEICLMDIATIAMKEMKKRGSLKDLDESDEINACSIVAMVDVDGEQQEWLVMFKNETHNHPTEIEPFGGAATCLGGAIRDPLSGRSYVYQAMRITGSGDPRATIEDTLPGKLTQRKITTEAAAGYSSYGNQIGLPGGQVVEIYDEGYIAKRMELGAVVAAAPRSNVVREMPKPGDVVILLGGRTGRDGCGGATGSSKAHTEESATAYGAQVPKGNPAEERKIQRFFRKPEVSTMIKKCNDFGAGGVSVAIGELAEGLEINLDAVPTKYPGLDGTELAISESQERMAVVVDKSNAQSFIDAAGQENLEATIVAVVTQESRLKIYWRGQSIVDISRDFLDTNGADKKTRVKASSPDFSKGYFSRQYSPENEGDMKKAWLENLKNLNVCSQKGLVERFDSTIGAGTVLLPYGGKYQLTPAEGMVAKIPVLEGDTTTGTIMTFGYNPEISKWSPFHGGVYAIVEAAAKITAMGGDYRKARLSLQEYFERLGDDPIRWGKPFNALLGAYYAQMNLGIPAIGGKDSMSGTFNDLTVPPTLVAFAVTTVDVQKVISPEFKKADSQVVMIPLGRDSWELPNFNELETHYTKIYELIKAEKILAAHTVKNGGIAEAISKMAFGNKIGFKFVDDIDKDILFTPEYGSLILEIAKHQELDQILNGIEFTILGHTCGEDGIYINDVSIALKTAIETWEQPLEGVFSTRAETAKENLELLQNHSKISTNARIGVAKPRVFIPVFPGTICEYDTSRAFQEAGAIVDTLIFKNLTPLDIEESLEALANKIAQTQILVIPGGLSIGDELEGTGKFTVAALRNSKAEDAIMELLNKRDGLILGMGDGFQALINLGLVPYGEFRDKDENSPALAPNILGRHVSRMVSTRVVSNLSPWFNQTKLGDIHTIALSHGQGRFVAPQDRIRQWMENGQIATQYVDAEGQPTYDISYNPYGSINAIEGITSPDGRVLGKMGYSQRFGMNVAKNISGPKDQGLFQAGVLYFK